MVDNRWRRWVANIAKGKVLRSIGIVGDGHTLLAGIDRALGSQGTVYLGIRVGNDIARHVDQGIDHVLGAHAEIAADNQDQVPGIPTGVDLGVRAQIQVTVHEDTHRLPWSNRDDFLGTQHAEICRPIALIGIPIEMVTRCRIGLAIGGETRIGRRIHDRQIQNRANSRAGGRLVARKYIGAIGRQRYRTGKPSSRQQQRQQQAAKTLHRHLPTVAVSRRQAKSTRPSGVPLLATASRRNRLSAPPSSST
ncbi:hypothetical protein D3C78_1036430 [compost metagenome]